MVDLKLRHQPQIEFYYEGYIYPFIGNANLKELIEMRTDKINSDNFFFYNKDARQTYFSHLSCIEQCICILFSVPEPRFAEIKLMRKQQRAIMDNYLRRLRFNLIFKNIPTEEKKNLRKILFSPLVKK
jgi:hypothetical protein